MMALPATVGAIFALNFLTYMSYYLDWIVCLVWLVLAGYFSASAGVATWKKEQVRYSPRL